MIVIHWLHHKFIFLVFFTVALHQDLIKKYDVSTVSTLKDTTFLGPPAVAVTGCYAVSEGCTDPK